jgi:hypothetical protein
VAEGAADGFAPGTAFWHSGSGPAIGALHG